MMKGLSCVLALETRSQGRKCDIRPMLRSMLEELSLGQAWLKLVKEKILD